jgi:AcrR family transcriptional regulator
MTVSSRTTSLPEPAGRRERRKAVTRRDLLLAGRKLFSEKGLYECRVEEITQRADIGKGTLYQYFRSKEDLVFDVVQMGFAEVARRTAERTARASRFEDIVSAIVESHLIFFAENPDLLKIFHQVRGMLKFNRPEWQPLRRILVEHLEGLARELERGGSRQDLSRARARELAGLLFGSVSGWFSVRVSTSPRTTSAPAPPGLEEALVAMARRFAATNGGAAPRARRKQNRGVTLPRSGRTHN